MRLWGSLAGVVLTAAVLIAGCGGGDTRPAGASGKSNGNSSAPANPRSTPPDNIRRVTIAELRDMLAQDKAVVVDVRGDEAYKLERIKGALNIPENQLTARAGELPKDKLLVFYCS